MSRIGQLTLLELDLLRRVLETVEIHFIQQRESITLTLVTTNDNSVRLKPSALDRDGIAVPASGLQVSVDKPEVASVAADPANPGQFLVSPLPATDPAAGSRTVIVTTLDPATGVSVQTPIEFDPGQEATLVVNTEIVPGAAATPAGTGTGSGGQLTNEPPVDEPGTTS